MLIFAIVLFLIALALSLVPIFEKGFQKKFPLDELKSIKIIIVYILILTGCFALSFDFAPEKVTKLNAEPLDIFSYYGTVMTTVGVILTFIETTRSVQNTKEVKKSLIHNLNEYDQQHCLAILGSLLTDIYGSSHSDAYVNFKNLRRMLLKSASYKDAINEFNGHLSDPKKAPEVNDPKKAPEVNDPKKASEVNDPKKASEVNDPKKAPEVNDPKKAPEVNDPKKAPEVNDPKKAPEVNDPKKAPEVNDPKKAPIASTSEGKNIFSRFVEKAFNNANDIELPNLDDNKDDREWAKDYRGTNTIKNRLDKLEAKLILLSQKGKFPLESHYKIDLINEIMDLRSILEKRTRSYDSQ